MADEYTSRYQDMTHTDLYAALMAGDPEQVAGVSAAWYSISETVGGIARDLQSDVDTMLEAWGTVASIEFCRRMAILVNFTTTLADQQSDLKAVVGDWGVRLAEAQANAEPPAEAEGDAADAAEEAAVAVGPVVGSWYGQTVAADVLEAAHDRMVTTVATVATIYGDASRLLPEVVEPDEDMPGTEVTTTQGLVHLAGSSASSSSAVSASSSASSASTATTVSYHDGSGTSTDSASASPTVTDSFWGDGGTTLAGAGGDTVVGLTSAASVGAGGVLFSQMSLGSTGASGGVGLSLGASGNTVPAGGVLASSSPSAVKSVNPTLAEGTTGQTGAATRTTNATPTSQTGRATTDDEDDSEYTTWLTEEDMVWGDDDNLPPSVLT